MDRRKVLRCLGLGGIIIGAGNLWQNLGASPQGKGAFGAAYGAENHPEPRAIVEMAEGAEDAPVTVIEYASLTCPHCRAFHINVYPQLKKNYIDTGNVRFILREIYFDRYGLWGSILARCDGNMARFFAIYDRLMHQQREWTKGSAQQVVQSLGRIGRSVGLSDEKFNQCFSDGATAKALVDWTTQNTEHDAIDATPSFIIDGEKYSNMSYAEFSRVLDGKIKV